MGENNNIGVLIVAFTLALRKMSVLYKAAGSGDLEQVTTLLGQGVDINISNEVAGYAKSTALCAAAMNDNVTVVQYLVEHDADMEKADIKNNTPLHYASAHGRLEVTRYLLEQGADRDKANSDGYTSLHFAARDGYLETARLLMVYGADLYARTIDNDLPIDVTWSEEIKQAIRDEPRRRMDEAPGKRATEQDRHPDAVASASAQQQDDNDREEHVNKKPRLDERAKAVVGKVAEEVAEEDQDSEPSDDEDVSN